MFLNVNSNFHCNNKISYFCITANVPHTSLSHKHTPHTYEAYTSDILYSNPTFQKNITNTVTHTCLNDKKCVRISNDTRPSKTST